MVAVVMRQPSQYPTIIMPTTIPIFPKYPTKFKENQKKIYYCQRCLNHDTPRPRKNHKCECPYADCTCEKCGLVEKRRILNIRLQNYNTPVHNSIVDSEFKRDIDSNMEMEDDEDKKNKGNKERIPNCQKCGQHGRKSRLKGHKRSCPFRECPCAKCGVVTERQKLMADQIKIRRRQRKDTLMNFTREHITSTINAAAAFSNSQINLQNLNSLLLFSDGSIKTSPQPLLSSPSSSDASSYSPSLQFPSPSLPIIIPTSADHSPNSQTPTSIATSIAAPTPIMAPLPINPAFPFLGLAQQGQDTALLLQTILDQYRLLEEAASMSISSSPSKDDESGDDDADGLDTDAIIDVCEV